MRLGIICLTELRGNGRFQPGEVNIPPAIMLRRWKRFDICNLFLNCWFILLKGTSVGSFPFEDVM